MMRRSLLAAALMATFAAQAAEPGHNTYTCTAVAQTAVVGAYLGDIVHLTELPERQQCRYSVNGAPSGSPPFATLAEAWAPFLAHQPIDPGRDEELTRLATALSSSWPGFEVPNSLISRLEAAQDQLARCFRAFYAGRSLPDDKAAVSVFEDAGEVLCQVIEPTFNGVLDGGFRVNFDGVPDNSGVNFLIGVRQLQLAVYHNDFNQYGKSLTYLFLPDPSEVDRLSALRR